MFNTEDSSFKQKSRLQEKDFFTTNGCYIRRPDSLIFCGNKYIHKFDVASIKFTVLENKK